MPVNNGIVSRFCAVSDGGGVTVEVYYDNTDPYIDPGANQPIIERDLGDGLCALRATNTSQGTAPITYTALGTTRTVQVPPGVSKLSKAFLASQGATTRADAQTLTLSSPPSAGARAR